MLWKPVLIFLYFGNVLSQLFFFLIGGELLYNIVLVAAVHESVIIVHMFPPFWASHPTPRHSLNWHCLFHFLRNELRISDTIYLVFLKSLNILITSKISKFQSKQKITHSLYFLIWSSVSQFSSLMIVIIIIYIPGSGLGARE